MFMNDVWAKWMGHSVDVNEVMRQADWTAQDLHELFDEACEHWRKEHVKQVRSFRTRAEANDDFEYEKHRAMQKLERLVEEYTSALAYELHVVVRPLGCSAMARGVRVYVLDLNAPPDTTVFAPPRTFVADLSYRQAWCLQGIASEYSDRGETPPIERVLAEAATAAGR